MIISKQCIPTEYLENVFSHMNCRELNKCKRVCREWKAIIENPKFMAAKKRYFKCLRSRNERTNPTSGASESNINMVTGFVHSRESIECKMKCFLEYLNNLPPFDFRKFTDLDRHPKYDFVVQILKVNYANIAFAINKDGEYVVNPRHVAALLSLFAKDSNDVIQTVNLLRNSDKCTVPEAMDFFYGICHIFYVILMTQEIPSRYFHQLHSALKMEETDVGIEIKADKPQKRLNAFKLTSEQQYIVRNTRLQKLTSTIIDGHAGTGKTSVLLEICRKHPKKKILVIVANRNAQKQWSKYKLKNVRVTTCHSLAHEYKGYGRGKTRVNRPMQAHDVARHLTPEMFADVADFTDDVEESLPSIAADVLNVIHGFCRSRDKKFKPLHVPEKDRYGDLHRNPYKNRLFYKAKFMWAKIKKFVEENYYMSDPLLYVKELQLSKPNYEEEYDALVVDDVQEMTASMLDIFLNQKIPKVFAGDRHQHVSQYVGFLNGLDKLELMLAQEPKRRFFLNQSLRFGYEISFAANSILHYMMKDYGRILVGNRNIQDNLTGDKDFNGKTAILSRSHAELFDEIVRHMRRYFVNLNGQAERPAPVMALSETAANFIYGKSGLMEVVKLIWDKNNPKLFNCTDFELVFDGDHQTDDLNYQDFKDVLDLYNKYKEELPAIILMIKKRMGRRSIFDDDVKIIFSTAYGFRGMEADNVKLLDDFCSHQLPYHLPKSPDITEKNFLYMAVTRARRCLTMNRTTYLLLYGMDVGYNFRHLDVAEGSFVCYNCRRSIEGPCLITSYPEMKMTSATYEGFKLCAKCSFAAIKPVLMLGKDPYIGTAYNQRAFGPGFCSNLESRFLFPIANLNSQVKRVRVPRFVHYRSIDLKGRWKCDQGLDNLLKMMTDASKEDGTELSDKDELRLFEKNFTTY